MNSFLISHVVFSISYDNLLEYLNDIAYQYIHVPRTTAVPTCTILIYYPVWCFATILTLGNIKNPIPGVPRDRIDPYANTWPFTMSLNGVLRNLNLIGYQTIDCYESFMIFLR